jgi:hypothetical protein
VVNDLAIEPASSLTQRSKDIITTGQIKALMVDAKDLAIECLQSRRLSVALFI